MFYADPNVLTGAFPNDFPNDNAYFSERRYTETQTAIFGEATYYFNPALRFTAGARYLRAKETLDRDGDFYFAAGPQHSSFTGKYHAFTPKFALSWDVDPANTLFASATEGFRLGGANRAIPYSLCGQELNDVYHLSAPPGTFESDSLWSYDIGNKSRFLDNRLSVIASAFWVKLQQNPLYLNHSAVQCRREKFAVVWENFLMSTPNMNESQPEIIPELQRQTCRNCGYCRRRFLTRC